MSKYYLVASYYNSRTNKYENETKIDSLKGEKLNILYKIDTFTSIYSTSEILKFIEQEKGKQGLNHLAIMYLKNKEATPIYYRIIDNDQDFNQCITTSRVATNYILGKSKNTIYINRNNALYRKEIAKILDILKSKDYNLFKSIYPHNNDFSFLVKRYINTSYDTKEAELEDLTEILVEFSRYKTFRGWYINEQKNNLFSKRKTTNKTTSNSKRGKVKKNNVPSIEENIQEFEKRFEKEQGISYTSYNTNKYNIDNEEYLSEEEYTSMLEKEEVDNSYKRH